MARTVTLGVTHITSGFVNGGGVSARIEKEKSIEI